MLTNNDQQYNSKKSIYGTQSYMKFRNRARTVVGQIVVVRETMQRNKEE